jgi:stearoyl-CoA desaturase (delta-9 desaturase)
MSDAVPYVAMAGATLLAGLAITQLAMLTTTVYMHRYLAHGGIELRPEVRAISRIVIWLTTALKPRQWAQVHRFHHASEDTAEDPHSPLNFGGGKRGGWRVLWRNAPLYTRSTRDPRLAEKYLDLTADRFDTWIFDHGEIGLVVGISVACALMAGIGRWLIGGWTGIIVGVAAGLAASGLHASYYVLAGGVINGFGHSSSVKEPIGGYATNLPILAWFTVGEGWHRNHHSAANSPRFGAVRQFDLGWVAICALRGLRLARVTSRGEAGLARLSRLRPSLTANRG